MSTTLTASTRRLAKVLHAWSARIVRDQRLEQLDDRALADIGVHRSEIASIEAEARRITALTRRRIVVAHQPA
jgi:uncharacterized protein YjiS (DUF1127 family)